jgi:hypothetical protein
MFYFNFSWFEFGIKKRALMEEVYESLDFGSPEDIMSLAITYTIYPAIYIESYNIR